MAYLYLLLAICGEILGTSALKAADGFTRLVPSLLVVVGYAIAFLFLSLVSKTIPIGVAYAIWSGVGIVLIAVVGYLFLGQTLDAPALLGMGLIVAGVLVVHLFSRTVAH